MRSGDRLSARRKQTGFELFKLRASARVFLDEVFDRGRTDEGLPIWGCLDFCV